MERRKNYRLDLSLTIHADLVNNQGVDKRKSMFLVTKDISNTGAFFITNKKLPLLSYIKIAFSLGDIAVRALAQIIRLENNGFAVNFTGFELMES